ncbi:MAG: hypothetical protein COZ49_03715 [Candidatus Yonathbacteria bacterium CG_4_10_14_3_um_filter_47_65]|uniref:prephenate dehydratase n=2 Tax=Parcubacteria group TaxID=1794811 RepID=A0A2M8D7A1_9BACT|nr:MAG: hypothetical protein AUJ44_04430 [Candidatus Nomurabacteria bacterium CG1_02_47_685]PIP04142.1 MAG: hypothetical protein COX54_00680 [Candidatus Yonathbacteria bacterium CG23_combo_of_CG06-09_8_20_14_all_46_18]PIQ31026.1 MAG: hypothetical protein COW61_04445 [Candidatus Yonathbacteria bacterium CG17_big_fil_post_rev_8_21_14_2_50_46_19]PIX56138.1 MAG: hypothetical protein COZ49_03715 [Candidatus Yonathbacteria bacterium CG_4_10_14_3_um_filter_47_65]PIY57296.1 MAG: hypothetical protein CO
MEKVTFLGPARTTFSHCAYDILAELFGAPEVIRNGTEANYIPSIANKDVLPTIIERRCYGAIAMETLAEGRMTDELEGFIRLLGMYRRNDECPFHVIGAIQLKIHFCFMARHGVGLASVSKIMAHPKALGACKKSVATLDVPTLGVTSNGEAARMVAMDDEYAMCAALAPRSAAEEYGLDVLIDRFEDETAITTFLLIAPKAHPVTTADKNRILVIFSVPHKAGSLVRALLAFDMEEMNLVQIHSVHVGNHTYHFAAELEVEHDQMDAMKRAMHEFGSRVERYLSFGPFAVISK